MYGTFTYIDQPKTPPIVDIDTSSRHPTIEVFVQCRRDGIQFQPGAPKQTLEGATKVEFPKLGPKQSPIIGIGGMWNNWFFWGGVK